MTMYHVPVLLNECIDQLITNPDGIYIDATFGGGGHSRAILEKLSPTGRLLAFDQDKDAWENATTIQDSRFQLIPTNFRYLSNYLQFYGVSKIDGLLADLGVSSHQFDEGSRGFSIRFDSELDMRMNTDQPVTAATIINTYSASQLTTILKEYGEILQAHKITNVLLEARAEKPILTTFELIEVLKPFLPKHYEYKVLAPIFQAFRIEVNQELQALKELLTSTVPLLNNDARLVVLSYHSLEDRIVKNFIRSGNTEGIIATNIYGNLPVPIKAIYKKVVKQEDSEEVENNNRSRSAVLRVAQKVIVNTNKYFQ